MKKLLIIWKSEDGVTPNQLNGFNILFVYCRAGVEYVFALPWIVSWFGHSLDSYRMVVRLYDYFLASPSQYMPLYVAAAIVLYLEDEIFKRECDLGELYPLFNHVSLAYILSLTTVTFIFLFIYPLQLQQDLPFEYILKSATEIYKRHPLEEIEPFAKQLLLER